MIDRFGERRLLELPGARLFGRVERGAAGGLLREGARGDLETGGRGSGGRGGGWGFGGGECLGRGEEYGGRALDDESGRALAHRVPPYPHYSLNMPARPRLKEIVAALARFHGKPAPFPSGDPWELILRENAAYLVDDATREEVFRSLKARVGVSPEAILDAPYEQLVEAIRKGGMRPPMRADKLLEASEIAREVGLSRLRALAKKGGAEARKVLERFPGIGEPGADRLLLAAGSAVTLAPESNGLRVLVRLGFAKEDANYTKMYRAAAEAVAPELPDDAAWAAGAHQLLRRHGQETCRRSEPRCDVCPLAKGCAFSRGR